MAKAPLRYGLMGLAIATAVCAGVTTAPAASASNSSDLSILALGDSVASGAGLPLVTSATPEDQACARSSQAYVQFVAQIKGLTARNLACSGATTFQGVLGSQPTPVGDVPSQLWRAYQGPRPGKVVTTIAANDVNWTGFLQSCLGASNCATGANTTQFHQLLKQARCGMMLVMSGIEGLHPQSIYVTGYYDPFDGNVVTPAQLGFTPEEVAWYQARRDELNTMLRQTAQMFPLAHFVALEFPDQSTTQLVQGPSDPAPFHPTAAGQQLIAHDVVAAM